MSMIPPVEQGYAREWRACKKCHRPFYSDYVPYSLSNPVQWLPCGHGLAQRVHQASYTLTEEEAIDRIAMRCVEAA